LHAYDISAQEILEIELPGPIVAADLTRGLAPDGSKLVLRAGSALNTDELALYQVDLPSFEVSQLTSLLSITVQRKIVNNEGTRPLETLLTVTRPDGLAWSPDGRFLAFTAALHNETSDLYVLDTLNDRIDRLNGLFSQNASPLWSPGGDWLITQELEYVHRLETWRSEMVSGLRVPSFDSHNNIYLPPLNSLEEVFVGWLNPYTFVSYSMTASGPVLLRQVNVDNLEGRLIFENAFQQVAYDPGSGVLVFNLSFEQAIAHGLSGGIYRLVPDSPVQVLQAAGNWDDLNWDSSGKFVASGTQGVLLFTPEGESLLLAGQGKARLSPNGNWLIAWGDGEGAPAGARLFQANSSNPLQTLTDQPVDALIWQPDSKGFFLFSAGALNHYVFPGLSPNEIITGVTAETILEWVWVE
jgi:dipeptidyl aminopeptidase/acylaminoacyl peptidase